MVSLASYVNQGHHKLDAKKERQAEACRPGYLLLECFPGFLRNARARVTLHVGDISATNAATGHNVLAEVTGTGGIT